MKKNENAKFISYLDIATSTITATSLLQQLLLIQQMTLSPPQNSTSRQQEGCVNCARDLAPIMDSLTKEQSRDVGVCSSTSGNVDSLDHSLASLVKHIRSRF